MNKAKLDEIFALCSWQEGALRCGEGTHAIHIEQTGEDEFTIISSPTPANSWTNKPAAGAAFREVTGLTSDDLVDLACDQEIEARLKKAPNGNNVIGAAMWVNNPPPI